MPTGQGLAVADIAQTILKAIVAHFATAQGVALPVRRIIAPGTSQSIAWDAEQLVVSLTGIGLGSAPTQPAFAQRTGNPISAAGMRHAIFAIQLVRCVPESKDTSRPPDAAVITAAGLAFMRDAGLLSQALVEATTPVAALLGGFGSVEPGAIHTIGPGGGMAANEGTLAVTAGILA